MTWSELKLVTLQKVFAISDGKLKEDDTTREYLTAMGGAAREALALLRCEDCKKEKTLTIVQDATVEERYEAEGVWYAPIEREDNVYQLSELVPDWYRVCEEQVHRDGEKTDEWELEDEDTLVLPAESGRWTLRYEAWIDDPQMIDEEEELPLLPEVVALLPLYMASQLYKDDDLSIATQYRNEFEVGREALRGMPQRSYERGKDRWRTVTGWW